VTTAAPLIPSAEDPFMTVAQIAAMFEVTPATVRGWFRDELLPGVKPGGKDWRTLKSEVVKFANKKYGSNK